MKKTLLNLMAICAVIFAVTLASCKKDKSQSQADKIVGKWYLKTAIGDYTTQGQNHKDTTTFTSADYYDFKADGSVMLVTDGDSENASWKVSNSKLIFTNTDQLNYTGGFDITILTSTTLQLHYHQTDANSTLDQTLNLGK
jgi:hypothetical protein